MKKQYEVKVGLNEVVYEMPEDRLGSFTSKLTEDCMPFKVREITEHIDRRGKWYITFWSGETRYCDSELEMYKTLYHTDRDVDAYGYIY